MPEAGSLVLLLLGLFLLLFFLLFGGLFLIVEEIIEIVIKVVVEIFQIVRSQITVHRLGNGCDRRDRADDCEDPENRILMVFVVPVSQSLQ